MKYCSFSLVYPNPNALNLLDSDLLFCLKLGIINLPGGIIDNVSVSRQGISITNKAIATQKCVHIDDKAIMARHGSYITGETITARRREGVTKMIQVQTGIGGGKPIRQEWKGRG